MPGGCETSTCGSSPERASRWSGPTGSGKTTLLRVLAGVLPTDEGSVTVRGRVGSLLATEVGLQALLTGRENSLLLGVLAGLSIAETRARMDEIAARAKLGDAFDRPIHTYSQGMRARLHLAAIQSVSAQVLLLDEIFEALDHEFREIVEEYARELREAGGIVVAAGHDHAALERICPRAVWLDGGRLRADGPFAEVIPRLPGRPPARLDRIARAAQRSAQRGSAQPLLPRGPGLTLR